VRKGIWWVMADEPSLGSCGFAYLRKINEYFVIDSGEPDGWERGERTRRTRLLAMMMSVYGLRHAAWLTG
jgi:hypothetical protein